MANANVLCVWRWLMLVFCVCLERANDFLYFVCLEMVNGSIL